VAPRANWKGFLKIGELTCQVSLFTAASISERIAFHTLNRKTGHRVRRVFVDRETGKPVEAEDQVKGYEVGQDEYVVLEPEEIAAAVPESDKTLNVEAFVACSDVDEVYFDRPYYLAPANPAAEEAFAIVREAMRSKKVAALARAVLFRRVRTLLIRPRGAGLAADTLSFDYEVKPSKETFSTVPAISIEGEMLDLAKHIIATKRGSFDPREFDDRYEDALADLVRAKIEGRPIEIRKPPPRREKLDLMEALRQSAGKGRAAEKPARGPPSRKATPRKSAASPRRRKAG
jgi:DNA end-binding protein Ku